MSPAMFEGSLEILSMGKLALEHKPHGHHRLEAAEGVSAGLHVHSERSGVVLAPGCLAHPSRCSGGDGLGHLPPSQYKVMGNKGQA